MARIKYSGLISEISGSVGGATFQRSAGGNTIRNKPMSGRKNPTASQLQIRINNHNVLKSWLIFGPTYRSMWDSAAQYIDLRTKHNPDRVLTGYQLFCKYNMLATAIGKSILQVPVYPPVPIYFTSIDFYRDGGDFLVDIVADYLMSDIYFLLKVSDAHRSSVSFRNNKCRIVSDIGENNPTFDITSGITALYNRLPEAGETISYSITFFGVIYPNISGPYTGNYLVT